MHDHQIIELIRSNREDKALTILYKHFSMVRKNIISNGGRRQDAEDVFQEALIILCRKAREPEFKLTSQLSTYLFGISRFIWKDELRKRKHIVLADVENGREDPHEREFKDLVEQEHEAELAEKILSDMGERCRELLFLFYQTGLKLKDIASKMGYNSENTAKNQKYKCLEGAKNRLKELKQATQTF